MEELAQLPEFFFRMVDVDDLDRFREQFSTGVPYPPGPISDHDLPRRLTEASAKRLPLDPPGEGRQQPGRVGCMGRLNGGTAGDRIRIHHRMSLLVPSLGAPDRNDLHVPGFRAAIRLFSRPPRDLRSPHRYTGAIHAQIQGRYRWRFKPSLVLLVLGNPLSRHLGRALHLTGTGLDLGEFPQQVLLCGKTVEGADQPDHALDARRDRTIVQSRRLVTRMGAALAVATAAVGALKRQRSDCGHELPSKPALELLLSTAGTAPHRQVPITPVGVQDLFQPTRHPAMGSRCQSRFQCFEIQRSGQVLAGQQGIDFAGRMPVKRFRQRCRCRSVFFPCAGTSVAGRTWIR